MNSKFPVLVLMTCIGAILCGCQKAQVPAETDEQLVQDQLTNDVVGYSRTISIAVEPPVNSNDVASAEATVEFVNTAGGIERTNLPYRIFKFRSYDMDHADQFVTGAEIDENEVLRRIASSQGSTQ